MGMISKAQTFNHHPIINRNGDFYKGEWIKDKKQGKGFYKWRNGNTYKGDWKNDQMNGRGEFVSPNAKTIVGMWKENKFAFKI